MYQLFKDAGTYSCEALDLAKMSQKIKKAIKLSLMTQIVNEKHGKIKFTCDLAPIFLRCIPIHS